MQLTSPIFENNKEIASKYSCDGEGVNPPLSIRDVPQSARSLALIVDDPDAPIGVFDHWVVWNIDPQIKEFAENSVPEGAIQGRNGIGKIGFIAPCPPSGTHHYRFKLYALSKKLDLPDTTDKSGLEQAMEGITLDQTELVGLYQRVTK